MKPKKPVNEKGSVEKAKPSKKEQASKSDAGNPKGQTEVSRLGGGYGGLQHEQYPNENGYADSGGLGKVEKKTS